MLSEDYLTSTSKYRQHHEQSHGDQNGSKAVARELLTSETEIFDVGPPSLFEEIIEDILAGSDQPYPVLEPSITAYHEDTEDEQHTSDQHDSDGSMDNPRLRRRDSIMASEGVPIQSREATKPEAETIEESAVQKVFGTYELLENILISVATLTEAERRSCSEITSVKTTLLARRVNKTFHHVIQRSTKLQAKLYFKYKADKSRASTTLLPPDTCNPPLNPLLENPGVYMEYRDHMEANDMSGYVEIVLKGSIFNFQFSLPSSFRRTACKDERKPVQAS